VRSSDYPVFGRAPVRLTVRAYFPCPKSDKKEDRAKYRWHTKRPDLSNLVKLIEDMGNGFLWHDDAQICSEVLEKFIAPIYVEPKTIIEIEELVPYAF
jgi:Holliday junction resolvase RusA-like endonuclease